MIPLHVFVFVVILLPRGGLLLPGQGDGGGGGGGTDGTGGCADGAH
jgi:hypothetical protein